MIEKFEELTTIKAKDRLLINLTDDDSNGFEFDGLYIDMYADHVCKKEAEFVVAEDADYVDFLGDVTIKMHWAKDTDPPKEYLFTKSENSEFPMRGITVLPYVRGNSRNPDGCECGAWTCKNQIHSTWCICYRSDQFIKRK